MTGSTISSTSAAITALLPNTEPPEPKPSRPGPRSPAWLLGYRRSCDRPSCALSRPEPIKLTVPCWPLNRQAGLAGGSGAWAGADRGAAGVGVEERAEHRHDRVARVDCMAADAQPRGGV